MRKKCIPMSIIINNLRHVFFIYCFIDISGRIFICFRGTMCQYASTFTRHTLSTANRLSHLNDQSKEISQCDTGKSDHQSHLSFNVNVVISLVSERPGCLPSFFVFVSADIFFVQDTFFYRHSSLTQTTRVYTNTSNDTVDIISALKIAIKFMPLTK